MVGRINVLVIFFVGVVLFLFACQSTKFSEKEIQIKSLFTLLPPSYTRIDFVNQLEYDEEFNVYTYRNFYNGGGVGLGDINNDGLIDIYFCGNMQPNKLYLNKGNFQFEDITEKAGVASKGVWSTGVSLVDVNGDGWVDIYVCKSGDLKGENRHNELFINNGDLTFTEKAKEYGIADKGLSTHAAFFDYDKDGDLDCYLLNNSFRSVGGYDLRPGQREIRDPMGGNKLYSNDGNHFTDVSEEVGIYGSAIGFGLGVTIGDVNRDGWQDIFVSNDFFERDYLYINNQDGTFTEALEQQIREISLGSMGADMGDINNDGYPEIFVTEMLPENDARLKTKTTFENWNKYQMNVENGYYHQFTRNVLQLNNGPSPLSSSLQTSPDEVTFSEIGRLAGVHATDWSWGALIADLNNDGYKDIYVANGIYKDLTDQDYIQFMGNPNTVRAILTRENAVIKQLIDSIPSEPISNYAFANQANLTFQNMAEVWGLATPSHSNGSAYGDLDNDGDLDLVVNNINMPPFIYRNEADTLLKDHHYLKFVLIGEGKNTSALGTQIAIQHNGSTFYQEQAPMRGFQSTVDSRLNFGLGNLEKVDSILVKWPDNKVTLLENVATNQAITLYQREGKVSSIEHEKKQLAANQNPILQEITDQLNIDYTHKENEFTDFDRDRLIYHMLSSEGPKLAKGDVNADGLDDFYIGGAKDQAGALFVQQTNGKFKRSQEDIFEKDKISEDTDCLFFDADRDRDLDLYVASGGNEFPSSSSALMDRLYINDGHGNFSKSSQVLPTSKFESTSCVQAADYDDDGDQDLFVGIRLRPFLYGVPVNGYILNNDGHGIFSNVTNQVAPELNQAGMITDGLWVDYDGDQDQDLIIAGEWMPIQIYKNDNSRFKRVNQEAGLKKTNGFWNCLKAGDFNQDGLIDFVAGNHGLNTRFKASTDKPVSIYINDFDHNGSAEQIITVYNGTETYPLALRHDLVMQMPSLKKKYLKYKNYKEQTIEDIFTPKQLKGAIKLEVYQNQSALMINQGDGTFSVLALPIEAQFSPMYGILVDDFDQDGSLDILMGGNFYRSKPEVGIYDASYGLFLKGDGKGNFEALSAEKSGFFLKGEVRDMISLKTKNASLILVAKNNKPIQIFSTSN